METPVQEPRIERVTNMKLVGMHAPMTFARPAMGALWRRFRPQASRIPHRASPDFASMRVYTHPPEGMPGLDATFEQWAAVEVTRFGDVPGSMDRHVVRGGLYAVFAYRGTPEAFADTARYIFRTWLPDSPYRLAPREHFEILPATYRPDDPQATEEIWIPVDPPENR